MVWYLSYIYDITSSYVMDFIEISNKHSDNRGIMTLLGLFYLYLYDFIFFLYNDFKI